MATAPATTEQRAHVAPHGAAWWQPAFERFGSGDQPLSHLPALDGLRGVAVAGVVCFHARYGWASGGFLGVSLFFTLSGFLITSLLLDEHRRTGAVDLRAFWERRFRRLLPAAWLTLLCVALVAAALTELDGSLRVDVWASLGNVANWRFLWAGRSYDDLFAQPSPVLHFWSLAIEEQCYVVLPLVVTVVLHRAARPRRALMVVLAVATVASIGSTLLASGTDRVYYGTDTRAAELLAGALLAVVVSKGPFRRRLLRRLVARTVLSVAGLVAALGTVILWTTADVDSPAIADGALLGTAFLSTVLVLSAATGFGPLARALAWPPLAWLGRVSYGVYLFHWPLMVFLTERRTGLARDARFVLVVALTLALAAASHRWFERPFRRPAQSGLRLRPARLAPVAAVLLVAVTLVGGSPASAQRGFDAEETQASLADLAERSAAATTVPAGSATSDDAAPTDDGSTDDAAGTDDGSPTTSPPTPPPAPTFAIFGDSVALSIAYPTAAWALTTGRAQFLGGDAELGCGIGRGGWQRAFGEVRRTAECDAWPTRWSALVAELRPALAVVQTGQWELVERRLPGDDVWRHVGDPTYDAYLRDELLAATDVLSSQGSLVVWVSLPQYSQLDDDGLPSAMRDSHDPARVDRFNEIVRDVVAARPDTARLLDLAAWMADKVDDGSLRADGSHFNSSGADRLASEFVGPELLRIWAEWPGSHDWAPPGTGTAGG